MVYTPKDWEDAPSVATPITAAELDRMEEGIQEGLRAASELQTGNVELASSTEMTTGTDLTRVPSVKRVADYVASAIAAGLSSLPTASQATESATGVVELATDTEMTTGTDLTRVPAVKRVVDYVTSAIANAITGKADISGSVSQFADVSDTAPTDADVLRWNGGLNLWSPYDLSAEFAEVGVDGRLIPTANPQYFKDILVINEGDTVPSTFPVGGIVLSRPATASVVPTSIGTGTSTATTTVTANTTVELAVGDYLYFAWAASADTVFTTISSLTVNAGAIAAYTEFGSGDYRSGTVQVRHGFARVTTTIPSGSTVTLTSSATRPTNYLSLVRCTGLAATTPNDSNGSLGGNGGSSSTLAISFGAMDTVNANDIAFMAFGFNAGLTPTNARTIAGTNGWTSLSSQTIPSARGLGVFYKVLTSTQVDLAGTIQFTAEDATSGAWAGMLGALRKA